MGGKGRCVGGEGGRVLGMETNKKLLSGGHMRPIRKAPGGQLVGI